VLGVGDARSDTKGGESVTDEKARRERGWIGVDLDGTLAHYTDYDGADEIGDPIEPMIKRVKKWLKLGYEVRVLTARASNSLSVRAIEEWLEENLGELLPITNIKDKDMIVLWDDRCVPVYVNEGEPMIETDEDDVSPMEG
jgi:hypothetical protein